MRELGVGRALLAALIDALCERGFRMACAGVALTNPASVGLHRALGFADVGVFRNIGWKQGAWRGVLWMERGIGDPGGPAAEQRPRPAE